MNKKVTEQGSAHVIVTVLIIVVLLGALGYVAWHSFANKKDKTDTTKASDSSKTTTDTNTSTADADLATFTAPSKVGISFKYPKDWTVKEDMAPTMGDNVEGTHQVVSYSASVYDADNKSVLSVWVNPNGLGGAGPATEALALHSTKLNLPTKSQSYATFIASGDKTSNSSSYGVTYGITSDKTFVAPSTSQQSLFYLQTTATDETLDQVMISGSSDKKFNSLDAVEAYYQSSEYQKIQAILESVTF